MSNTQIPKHLPPYRQPQKHYQPAQQNPANLDQSRISAQQTEAVQWMRPRRRFGCCGPLGCGTLFLSILALTILLVLYLAIPGQTKVLVLGLDYTPPGSDVGRSDTIILTAFDPIAPRVSLLSVPRDLWVSIPAVGENRINTAHFFGEAQQTGYGPEAAIQTIQHNFGVKMNYYVRIHFEGFKEVVNALGGVDIELPEPMAGYPAGRHHLTGNKALAFARSRMGSDDFFRMEQGQLLVKAILQQMFSLKKLPRLPGVLTAVSRVIDTNMPTWQLPRLGFALLRTGVDGIDNRTISREMVTPYITDQGANILLPDWGKINPLVAELLGD